MWAEVYARVCSVEGASTRLHARHCTVEAQYTARLVLDVGHQQDVVCLRSGASGKLDCDGTRAATSAAGELGPGAAAHLRSLLAKGEESGVEAVALSSAVGADDHVEAAPEAQRRLGAKRPEVLDAELRQVMGRCHGCGWGCGVCAAVLRRLETRHRLRDPVRCGTSGGATTRRWRDRAHKSSRARA